MPVNVFPTPQHDVKLVNYVCSGIYQYCTVLVLFNSYTLKALTHV